MCGDQGFNQAIGQIVFSFHEQLVPSGIRHYAETNGGLVVADEFQDQLKLYRVTVNEQIPKLIPWGSRRRVKRRLEKSREPQERRSEGSKVSSTYINAHNTAWASADALRSAHHQ